MIGFLVGTACLVGLVRVLRRGSCGSAYGYGGGCGPRFGGGCGPRFGGFGPPGFGRWGGGPFGHGHHHGHGHGGWAGRNMALRFLFEHLDTTPGQEKVILQVFEEVREVGKKARDEAKRARGEVARAVRGESFDTSAMAEASARVEAAMASVRDAATTGLMKIHDALDDRQRKRLAELIEDGPGFFRRYGGGPYRGGWGGEEV